MFLARAKHFVSVLRCPYWVFMYCNTQNICGNAVNSNFQSSKDPFVIFPSSERPVDGGSFLFLLFFA